MESKNYLTALPSTATFSSSTTPQLTVMNPNPAGLSGITQIAIKNGTSTNGVVMGLDSGNHFILNNRDMGSKMVFCTEDTERMSISRYGAVQIGIGTPVGTFDAPTGSLYVGGGIRGNKLTIENILADLDITFLTLTHDTGTVNITPRQLSFLTNVTSALATESFVTNKNYLTALPSSADFTTLTIGTKAVATEEWVNSQGFGTSSGSGSSDLPLTGGTLTGTLNLTGTNVIQLGLNTTGKEANAGKIGYQMTTSDALDIYGAGTLANSRKIKLWDNVTIPGSLGVGGAINIPSTTDSTICINMGSDLTKGAYAGRIYYNPTSGPGSTPMLEIWGGATGTNSKTIKLWDNVIINGALTLGTAGLTASGTSFTAAEVKSYLIAAYSSLPKTGGKLTGNLGINLPAAQTNPNYSLDVGGTTSTASLKITNTSTGVEDGKSYVLLSTTTGGPGTSVSGKELASCTSDFILKNSGASTATALPYGDYAVAIRSSFDSMGLLMWNGYVSVGFGGYTNLTQSSKGSKVSSVVVSSSYSLTITYTSAADAPTATNYYQVTMTPCLSFQNEGMSRFNKPIGLPFSYTNLPYADFGHLGGVISASISDTMTTTALTAFASLSLPAGVWIVTYCITSTVGFTIEISHTGCRQSSSGAAYSCVGSYIASGTSAMTCSLSTITAVTLDTAKSYHKAVRIA